MRPKLIGVAGYARVGKSTVGDILEREFGYEQRAFADKVRELAYEMNPLIDNGCESVEWRWMVDEFGYEAAKTRYCGEGRDMLVQVSAGARKVLGGDVWLDACLPRASQTAYDFVLSERPHVITDVRYANEALRIKQLGGEVWMVQRPGVLPANAEEEMSIPLVPVDRFIYNGGTLEDLESEVRRAVDA